MNNSVHHNGNNRRDFTYTDDIIEGAIRVLGKLAPDRSGNNPDSGTSYAPWKVYYPGNNNPVELKTYFVKVFEYIREMAVDKSVGEFVEWLNTYYASKSKLQ